MTDCEDLYSIIDSAVRKSVGGSRVGILFSGGIDSTVIAAIANRYSTLAAYTVGVEGSHDLAASRSTSAALGLAMTPIVLTEERILDSIRAMLKIVRIEDPVTVSFQLPAYLVAEHSDESILLSGQGADELFGGYARYETMDRETLERSMEKDLHHVMAVGSELDKKIAEHFGKRIVHPYLDPRVVDFVQSLEFNRRVYGGVRKALLRDAARVMGLGEVAERPKKAAQYGTGIMKSMKASARKRKLSLQDLIAELASRGQES